MQKQLNQLMRRLYEKPNVSASCPQPIKSRAQKNTGSKRGEKKLKDELQYQHKIVPTLKTSRNASEKALLIQTRSCICLSTPPKHTDAHQKLEKHIVNEGGKALKKSANSFKMSKTIPSRSSPSVLVFGSSMQILIDSD